MRRAPIEMSGGNLDPARFEREVVQACRPVVIRALVDHWPVVQAARTSPRALQDYLAAFHNGGRVDAFFGDPAIAGKYYYNAGLEGFNFERRSLPLAQAVQAVVAAVDRPESGSVYVGSVPAADFLPGFAAANPMALIAGASPRIWLGTASNVSSHYDTLDNLACVIAGRRRFTLYSPECIGRLYVGPIDNTMAGQPVSLAASAPSGIAALYPRFEEIRDDALSAELEPGDALYLPKLWWHQVQSTAPFNGLVNYWWDAFSAGPDAPYTALLLSMIAIAERPEAERKAWRAFFDHYVFRSEGHPLAHLPPEKHGLLGPLKPNNYSRLRAHIMQMLRGG